MNIEDMAPNNGRFLNEQSQAVNLITKLEQIKTGIENIDIPTVDSSLDAQSTNPVQNRAIATAINDITSVVIITPTDVTIGRNSNDTTTVRAANGVTVTATDGEVTVDSRNGNTTVRASADVDLNAHDSVNISALSGEVVLVSDSLPNDSSGVLTKAADGTVELNTTLVATVASLQTQIGDIETVLNALV